MRSSSGFAIIVSSLIGLAASACSQGTSDPVVENAWLRAPPPGAPTAAIYLTIVNRSSGADRLINVATPIAKRATLHRTVEENGMTGMRPVESLDIPVNGKVVLEPGGRHIMLEGLAARPAPGEAITLTLRFDRAGEMAVEIPVRQGPPAN